MLAIKKMVQVRKLLLLLVSILVTAVLFFLIAGYVYTSSSYFCANCHEMSTQYIAWRRSTHSETHCLSCHSEPGAIGEIKAHFKGSVYFFKHFLKMYSSTEYTVEIKNASCQTCHKEIKEKDRNFKDIHLKHGKAGLNCTDCHAGLVHGNLGGGIRYQKMSCIHCHPEITESNSKQ